MRRIGVHASIAGGIHLSLERAQALGCTTVQIFSHNPRGWALIERPPEAAALFREARQRCAIDPVYIHTSYLVNLASPDKILRSRSSGMVAEELRIADLLGAEYVVLHTGSASKDDPAAARQRAIECFREIGRSGGFRSRLLLENTAGERGDITSQISDLSEMVGAAPEGLVAGVCIDTCHAFSAGYDLRSEEGLERLAWEIHSLLGRDAVRLVHLNDAKADAGAGIDRHEHIGRGKIGSKGLQRFLQHPLFREVPLVLETPKKTDDDDRMNLRVVQALIS